MRQWLTGHTHSHEVLAGSLLVDGIEGVGKGTGIAGLAGVLSEEFAGDVFGI